MDDFQNRRPGKNAQPSMKIYHEAHEGHEETSADTFVCFVTFVVRYFQSRVWRCTFIPKR